jgi:hypothetical protein
MVKRFLGFLLAAACLSACGGEMTSGGPPMFGEPIFTLTKMFLEPPKSQSMWGDRYIISPGSSPTIEQVGTVGPVFNFKQVMTPKKYVCDPSPCRTILVSSLNILPFSAQFRFRVTGVGGERELTITSPSSLTKGLSNLFDSPDWDRPAVTCTSNSAKVSLDGGKLYVSAQTRPGMSGVLIDAIPNGGSSYAFQFVVDQTGVERYRLSGIGTGPAAGEPIVCSVPAPSP